MDKSKHTEYEIQQLREYGYIKYPFKKQNNNKKNLQETTPIIKDECWKCKEEIEYTDLFYYCPLCLAHQ
jgi:hypothetical protein